MKKFLNLPENAVEEMLQGLAVLNPDAVRLPGHKVMIRADAESVREQQIALISGGGSGHEPAHAGYIGAGMLTAAMLGEVFTSPDTDSIVASIKAVAGRRGALLVVKNYTGDRLNFGLAAEIARSEGIPVEMIVVHDDVALTGSASVTGPRGLAGTIFIHKIVGAAAAEGRMLADVAEIGRAAIKSLATMGVSLSAGTSPTVGKPSFELGDDEIELGLGIHGEPGVRRTHLQPLMGSGAPDLLKYPAPRTPTRVRFQLRTVSGVLQKACAKTASLLLHLISTIRDPMMNTGVELLYNAFCYEDNDRNSDRFN